MEKLFIYFIFFSKFGCFVFFHRRENFVCFFLQTPTPPLLGNLFPQPRKEEIFKKIQSSKCKKYLWNQLQKEKEKGKVKAFLKKARRPNETFLKLVCIF